MGRTCKESVDEAREEMSGRRKAVSRSSRVGEEARGEEAKEPRRAGEVRSGASALTSVVDSQDSTQMQAGAEEMTNREVRITFHRHRT